MDGAVTAVTLLVTRHGVTDNTRRHQHTRGTCHVSRGARVTDKTLADSGLNGLTLEPTPFSGFRWILSFMGFIGVLWRISPFLIYCLWFSYDAKLIKIAMMWCAERSPHSPVLFKYSLFLVAPQLAKRMIDGGSAEWKYFSFLAVHSRSSFHQTNQLRDL